MATPQTHEFIAEAKDHLAEICDQLLRLERSASEAASDRIESMLRAAHSVKGGAGFFGLRAIEQLAHRMESVLEAVIATSVPSTSHTVDVLLAATDRVAALLDDIEASNLADISDVLLRLDELLQQPPVDNPAAPLPADAGSPTAAVSESEQAPAVSESRQRFPLEIDLTACQEQGLSPDHVVERVLACGDVEQGSIAASLVDLDRPLPLGTVTWRGWVTSELPADEFYARLQLPHGDDLRTVATAAVPPVVDEHETLEVTRQPAATAAASAPERINSIRIPVELADRLINLSGELVLVRNQTRRFAEANQPLPASVVQRFDAVTSDFQETVLQTRMQPVGNLFNKFPRLVRDLARQLGKQIELQMSGAEVELDKAILDAISDPLIHLVRNACDHGIETPELREAQGKPVTGRIRLVACHAGDQICLRVEDDGRGVDREAVTRQLLKQGLRTPEQLARLNDRDLIALILLPGFSTATQVTDVSGRGVGTDVVRTNLAQLGGTVEIESQVGRGTTFTLRLPLTLAIIPALLISSSGHGYAIPQKDLEELVRVDAEQTRARIEWTKDQELVRLRGRLLPLVRLSQVLNIVGKPAPLTSAADAEPHAAGQASHAEPLLVAIVRAGSRRFALAIDRVLASEEIVVKPMHTRLRGLPIYSGATVLGDGSVALILNTEGIAQAAQTRFGSDAAIHSESARSAESERQDVLMVRQFNGEQSAVPVAMIRRVVMVERTRFALLSEAWYTTIDGVPTQLRSLGKSTAEWESPGLAFVLLPRDLQQPNGWVVPEVLGIEHVGNDDVHALPADPQGLGAAVLRGQITPLIDLQRLARDAAASIPAAEPACSDPTGLTRNGPTPQPARVLLVDDTQFFRDAVGRCLRDAGYAVTTAEHGADALERLQHESFDLVVSDLEMPVLDGLGLAKAVRGLDTLRNLPLLALTTLSGDTIRQQARQHGFDAFEVKLDKASLLAAVHQLLAQRQVTASNEEPCHA